ncbi:SusC/RagA family TonB-linked outer membrane protein [Capnocytophaga canimorsus]|nr:SusC/RagA family TonB-linked outer membrane protein [Capnocytophaga canimorsus]
MIDLLSRSNSKGKLSKFLLMALVCGLWADAIYAKAEITSVREVVEQQTKKVSGTVTDEFGQPLPGVSVFIKGTQRGITTDFDGNYQIQASQGEVLVFSYVGFVTQEKVISSGGNEQVINVSLKEETQQLEQVVVTALGIKRQEKALSYNVQQVKSEELTKVKETNIVNSLNGKVAGVNIQRSASGVGGATKVVMRGLKSIDGNNGVLYVIDGVPMFNRQRDGAGYFGSPSGGESISDINPEDVESINVLTGPSAAALYGSQAANGVILINTKKGKEGKMEVNVSSSLEMITPTLLPQFQDTYGSVGQKSWGPKLSEPSGYDPSKFFRTGTNITNAITLSTGTKQNQTFVSAAQTDAKGVIPNSDYYRTNISVRNTSSFLNDKLHLDISGNFIRQGNRNMISGGGYFNPLVALYLMPRSLDYRDIEVYERFNPQRGIYEKYQPYPEQLESFFSENPYWVVNRELFLLNKKRYIMAASLKYDILDWLNVTGRIRLDNDNSVNEKKLYASTNNFLVGGWKPELGPYNKGHYSVSNGKDEQTYADIMFNANKNFGEDFSLTANLGASYNDQYNTSLSGGGMLLNIPNLFSSANFVAETGVGQGYSRTKNVAVFGSAEIGYKRMLYLSLTGRNDWSSQLVNSSEPSFFYPSVGLSAVLSEMFKMPDYVDFVKVRGSYTEVGSPISRTGVTPGTITHSLSTSGIKANRVYPYPDFKAERTRSFEFGLNTKLFKNALSLDLTLYKSNTFNQLFEQELSATSLYSSFLLQAGNVENRGVELAVSFQKDLFKDFNWSSTVTYSHNKNEIKELVRGYLNPFTGERFDITERGNLREGGSMSDIIVKKVLARDVNGDLIEEAATFKVDETQEIKIGSSTPDFQMGWKNTFSYKGFDLSVLFNGSFGGVVLSGTQPYLDAYGVSKASADARDAGGVLVNGKLYDPEKYYSTIKDLPGYYSYDATNVRLQEASLSYTFDGKLISNGIKRITFGLIGTNLWMIYNKAPFDPQLSFGVGTYAQTELFMTPAMRTYGLSLKLQF